MNDAAPPITPASDTAPRAAHGTTAIAGERVSVLSGDRPCARCAFNLTGQHVLREPHYGMLVVVCPECGTPASLQEYPLLGKWAGRWGAVLAALWVLFTLVLLAASAGTSFGFGVGATESSGEKFALFISERQLEWAKTPENERVPPASPGSAQSIASIVQQGPHSYAGLDAAWWDAQNPKSLLAQAGGWWRCFDWTVVYIWAGACIPLSALGIVWSVVLSHVRRSRLWIMVPVVFGAAGAIAVLVWSVNSGSGGWSGRWISAIERAREVYFVPLVGMSLVAEIIPFVFGLMIGRTLARWMVRAFLPPRLRAPLSFLWLCDGKTLPRPAP